MLLTQLLCSILFIPLISGGNNATVTKESVVQSSLKESTKSVQPALPTSNIKSNTTSTSTIILEGGSTVIAGNAPPSATLPKESPNNLLNLDLDLANDKLELSSPSTSKIKARKGAETNTTVTPPVTSDKIKLESKAPTHGAHNLTTAMPKHEVNITLRKTVKEEKANETIQPTHKKPTILSSERLDKIDIEIDRKIPAIFSSSKTKTVDQLSAPHKALPMRVQQTMKSNSHPGMVMPVVITILVVPTFAVLGYMALRRGREAWKNRHYKRMDFLLDGMYNE